VVHDIEHLLCKHKTLSSNSSLTRKKDKKGRKEGEIEGRKGGKEGRREGRRKRSQKSYGLGM
jgi:hypothetical protein